MSRKEAVEKTSPVLFTCQRYPELNVVLDSTEVVTDPKSGRSRTKPGKSVSFVKMGFEGGFRGELLTEDADVIQFLRAHEWYGRFIKEAPLAKPADRVQPQTVVSGLKDGGVKEPAAPVDVAEPAGKAKIASGIRRGRPAKTAVPA